MLRPWILLGLLSYLLGCPPADDDDSAAPQDDDDSTDEVRDPTWTTVSALIGFRCGCHDAAQRAGGMYDLTRPDVAYAVLVDRPSDDVPGMDRIEPGDPEASYLVAKIEGRQQQVGGRGDRMPPTGFPLPDDDIDLIRDWVTAGALDD